MMESPFSPFVHRRPNVRNFKRRQSELPSDLIDWDAPEIPELDKQKIIYEEYIKELNEEHSIEMLISEEVCKIASQVYVETTHKQLEDIMFRERAQNNLLLGQHKLSQDHIQELEATVKELEVQCAELKNKNENLESQMADLENQKAELVQQKENVESRLSQSEQKLKETQVQIQDLQGQNKEWETRYEEIDNQNKELDEQTKVLEFRNKELETDLGCQFEAFALKKAEALDFKRKWESAENKLSHLRKEKKFARETK